jgi:photosystem II stability/assembly factor-like uncharacterized protein
MKRNRAGADLRFLGILLLSCIFLCVAAAAQTQPWILLGPEGGDARSLAYDPHDSSRILLGTSAGELYQSTDGGRQWSRFAHLGKRNDDVLDHIIFDPRDHNIIYVAGWSIENDGGDIFRSEDGGHSWAALPGMHGKSIRALALAPSDPNIIVAGALDGVYRSSDAGKTWQLISPPHHAEIHNIESVAIDPRNPEAVYAGTWHLPWKTDDGGRNWHSIKNGLIDDSDVFSIKVDPVDPQNVYLSACSGIYKSESAGELFHKIQGIPSTARRTRVLQQDPSNSLVVYAGTTEGLWKTLDAGKTWKRMGPANLIINDVMVDPRNPQRVLLATDRSGVLASDDGGQTAVASNRGFSHRQVSGFAVSPDGQTLYAGVVNDKEFGGVFTSSDAGAHWRQINTGLAGEDIFSLALAQSGALVAGTNRGIFIYEPKSGRWHASNLVLNEKLTPVKKWVKKKRVVEMRRDFVRSQLRGTVSQVAVEPQRWLAATPDGLYISLDQGASWHGGPVDGESSFVSVSAAGERAAAATPTKLLVSRDGGREWQQAQLPKFVTRLHTVSVEPKRIWITSHEGAFFSNDDGQTWQHVIVGDAPPMQVVSVSYDAAHDRTLAAASDGEIFATADGHSFTRTAEPGRSLRSLAVSADRIYGITQFSGIIAPATPAAGEHAAIPAGNRMQ